MVTPFQTALQKLGIQMSFRTVDFSLSQQRMENFDFEMTTIRLPGSTAPGGELLELFGSRAAETKGSSNIWGIADPAVDALLQKVVGRDHAAGTRRGDARARPRAARTATTRCRSTTATPS